MLHLTVVMNNKTSNDHKGFGIGYAQFLLETQYLFLDEVFYVLTDNLWHLKICRTTKTGETLK